MECPLVISNLWRAISPVGDILPSWYFLSIDFVVDSTKEFLDDLDMKNISDLPDLPDPIEANEIGIEDQVISQAI